MKGLSFPEAATRRSDPETSFEAARGVEHKLKKLQRQVYAVIEAKGRDWTTAWHVEEAFGDHTTSTYRTRIAELCGIGAVEVRIWPPLVIKTGQKMRIEGTQRERIMAASHATELEVDTWLKRLRERHGI